MLELAFCAALCLAAFALAGLAWLWMLRELERLEDDDMKDSL